MVLSEPWALLSSLTSLAPQGPRLPCSHVRSSAASPGSRAVFKKQFPAEEDFFFPKELKQGTSWCRLFMGNHCESSFTTQQEGLSLSRLHPALCSQPSCPVHAQGVSSVTLTPLPRLLLGC